jgi:transcriptional regulator with XRE-family HTH domain
MISCYESDRSSPDAEFMSKVAAYFDVSMDFIAGFNVEDEVFIKSFKEFAAG